ncbi:hypothetical protein AVEN_138358-1 [Araneus ventricosus]|uniref:Uncharacterized protein n=1 Tax=Araneus ventricosus TaxID=182803 RepID=A0A4Y2UJT9_ARAVE|nr:hypothetical protein AVEN_117632-1 [Araneus ventricosus]GBO11810.1 hypothetical protein AVEN_138358-1 [Araneus ventricosus]
MGLEVENDIDELKEDHNQELNTEELKEDHSQELNTEELTDLHCVSQQEVVKENLSEEETWFLSIWMAQGIIEAPPYFSHIFAYAQYIFHYISNHLKILLGTREIHVLNIELDKEGHHKLCVLDGLIVGWIDLTEYLLASTYDEFIDSGNPHFLQEKRETSLTYVIHHRLAILLDRRGIDVLNLELDKTKIKHSSRGVCLSCPGKDYLLDIRGTDADPHRSP